MLKLPRSISLIIGLVFSFTAFAADPPIKVKVTLYPMGSFEATSDRVEGTGKKTGDKYEGKEFKVLVDSLKTNMSLRDRHLHEKLESDKYKYITVTNVKASGGEGTADIKIHNVPQSIKFKYTEAGAGKATATFKLHLKDFNLTKINYKGVGVEDEVEVTAAVPYQ